MMSNSNGGYVPPNDAPISGQVPVQKPGGGVEWANKGANGEYHSGKKTYSS